MRGFPFESLELNSIAPFVGRMLKSSDGAPRSIDTDSMLADVRRTVRVTGFTSESESIERAKIPESSQCTPSGGVGDLLALTDALVAGCGTGGAIVNPVASPRGEVITTKTSATTTRHIEHVTHALDMSALRFIIFSLVA